MSQELGIPSSQEDWAQKDHEVFANYEREHTRYVSGWSSREWKLEIRRSEISQELGIPWEQEDWTTDDWQRFSQEDRNVPGWGHPTDAKAEVERRQVGQKLGIPFNQAKWTTEDRQKFDEYQEQEYGYVEGWSSRSWCERKRRQAGMELRIPYESDKWTPEDRVTYFASGKKDVCCWPSPPTPPTSEKGDSPELERHEEPPEKSNGEDQQSKDDIIDSANKKDDDAPAPTPETEPPVPEVLSRVEEPQQSNPSGAVVQPKHSDDNNNSETPTAPETKPLILVPHAQVSPEIDHHGISPIQAFALLLVALVPYELIRQNLRL